MKTVDQIIKEINSIKESSPDVQIKALANEQLALADKESKRLLGNTIAHVHEKLGLSFREMAKLSALNGRSYSTIYNLYIFYKQSMKEAE